MSDLKLPSFVLETLGQIVVIAQHLTQNIKILQTEAERVSEDRAIGPSEVATLFHQIKLAHEALDAQTKALYHIKDRLDKAILPERLETFGMDLIRVPELARSFSVQDKISASFIDKEAGFKWLREIGQGDIITETVNAGTLASFIRNLQLEQGIEPPPEIVKVTPYKSISSSKYTPK